MTTKHRIETTFVQPPIPVRGWDWQATYAGTEGYYAGWGETEEAAVKDLKQRYDWEEEQCTVCGDHHDGDVPFTCETGDGV